MTNRITARAQSTFEHHVPDIVLAWSGIAIHAGTPREKAMRLIDADELRQFSEILKNRSCSLADFELHELDMTDPKSDELSPMRGYVEIRRKSNDAAREYTTGDGTSWVSAFEKDLGSGRFG
jgi:hypothetical protein